MLTWRRTPRDVGQLFGRTWGKRLKDVGKYSKGLLTSDLAKGSKSKREVQTGRFQTPYFGVHLTSHLKKQFVFSNPSESMIKILNQKGDQVDFSRAGKTIVGAGTADTAALLPAQPAAPLAELPTELNNGGLGSQYTSKEDRTQNAISAMEKRPRTEDQEPEGESQERPQLQCAELILPLLQPAELAATSSTCKTLYRIAKSITADRASDASGGFEELPIPFVNAIDDQPYAFFIYTPSQTLGSHTRRTRPVSDDLHPFPAWGCECDRCDGDAGCPCLELNSVELTRECGLSCRCGMTCGNRLTQEGVSVRLKIVKDRRKGWGLHAGQLIRRGQFVCEYAGELLTTKEARRRQQIYDQLASGGRFCSALLVVREHLPSGKASMRINIDATMMGNVSRFINHSCDGGNLSTVLVRSSGALLPRLCFFASRDIQEDGEITFSYGEIRLKSKGLQCFCGSSSCIGVLPSENT